MKTPMQIINAALNVGVALLVYDNTAVPRGVIQLIFDYQIRGSQNIAHIDEVIIHLCVFW